MLRLASALCAAVAATAPAFAQTSVFEGRWRAVSAEPAPWTNARPQPAPWLRAGFVFKDGKARLPPGMACGKLEREENWIPSRWILGGEMSGRVLRAFYARHGITEGQNVSGMTLTCDDREIKLVLTEEGRALAAHEGWIYLLRRRESGEDAPSDEAFVARANAGFDCAKAVSATERLICGLPDAMEADAAMAAAYEALRASLSPPLVEALRASQRVFGEDRVAACNAQSEPKEPSQRGEAERCLGYVTVGRAGYLRSLAPATAGPIRIEPRLTTEARRRSGRGWITQDARPVLFGATPAVTKAFDQAVDKAGRYAKPLQGFGEEFEGGIERSYAIELLTTSFVSIRFLMHVEAGTSAPPSTASLNFDLRSGKALRLADIFDTGSARFREAIAAAIRGQVEAPELLDGHLEAIAAGTGAIWTFGEGKAGITWQAQGAAPPEGVEVPGAVLAPFLKNNSPWRP